MEIIELYNDYKIDHVEEGHKHCRPGWTNVECPFCTGNPGYHLGYNLTENYFYCWRCGSHSVNKTLMTLLKLNYQAVKKLITNYGGIRKRSLIKEIEPKIKIQRHPFKFPSNTEEMKKNHRRYLEKRGFNPEQLETDWDLKGTGPISGLKTDKKLISYSHRILAPIYWNGKIVTFQARDITDKHLLKYMACPKEREMVHHKHLLYGKQERWGDTGICVEGITDVWRMGFNSFATLGIEYTPVQLRLIAKTFKRVPIVYDGGESQAIKQANKMAGELKFRGVDAFRVDIEGDPASMKQEDADYLIKQLI